MRPFLTAAPLAAAALLLGGCLAERTPLPGAPTFYERLDAASVTVDPAAAASMITGYRANKGLTAVTVDPALNALAQEQANAMARADKVDHTIRGTGSFETRITRSGYDAEIAVENIGAGYRTLAEAFSGWRDSPSHNKNMLRAGVTRLGIATAYSPKSKYKVYWSLVLAKPAERRQEGPSAGPMLPVDGSTTVTFGGAVVR
ncbi:CAP domain-containing protein [Prosthecomicrobium pneumaticum]|uniref:Uncharacterized protein YkwD n=1 Tax=Prosthecomicrobium pneumaticum TaxID=81895 RepID=A0A7W9L465_9HYPH|nr:CAP domain-containing protein [Prosthecomicrobium pneumaticum]MBB5755273.1 uncharacterized protein YkwD [Prosthecomicrobium pneumaticum]